MRRTTMLWEVFVRRFEEAFDRPPVQPFMPIPSAGNRNGGPGGRALKVRDFRHR
jgi:hypothetical protein